MEHYLGVIKWFWFVLLIKLCEILAHWQDLAELCII